MFITDWFLGSLPPLIVLVQFYIAKTIAKIRVMVFTQRLLVLHCLQKHLTQHCIVSYKTISTFQYVFPIQAFNFYFQNLIVGGAPAKSSVELVT
jgi:hypothetical protein